MDFKNTMGIGKIKIVMLKGEKGEKGDTVQSYNELSDKPQINGVELSGIKTTANLKLNDASALTTGTLAAARLPNIPVSKVTGIVPLTQGGTGKDYSSVNANQVFASASVDGGKPYFRKLVANDIPNLNASKITAGTLAAARLPKATSSAVGAVKPDGKKLTVDANGKLIINEDAFDLGIMDVYSKGEMDISLLDINQDIKAVEDTISYLTPKVLYNNGTGTKGTVTLSESIENYTQARIYFNLNSATNAAATPASSVLVQAKSPAESLNGVHVLLNGTYFATNTIAQNRFTTVKFSAKTITVVNAGYTNLAPSTGTVSGNMATGTAQNGIYIYRVEAWK